MDYQFADSPTAIRAAAETLAAGRGPFAIDTERASGFRYDDRAFLVQIRRRDAGIFLIDPEGHRPAATQALAPVLNNQDWVLHAAATDLPSLAMLGLYPATIFDTELASRLSGFDKVNLAAMVEEFFDVSLTKGHGAEDWSARPIPDAWLNYAALDVACLLELAEALTELLDQHGKLQFAEQEFSHIIHTAAAEASVRPSWRDTKGVSALRRPEQLAVARHLWEVRDAIAQDKDLAIGRILPNKVLTEVARQLPNNAAELARVRGFPGRNRRATQLWWTHLHDARNTPADQWPRPLPRRAGPPSKSTWQQDYPQSWDAHLRARAAVAELAAEMQIPAENLLKPALLRHTVWEATEGAGVRTADGIAEWLSSHHARPWQIQLVAPLIVQALSD